MSPDGKIIASSGNYGEIHLFTAKSKEWITTLKMNGAVNALTFNSDGKRMYSFGGKIVYIFSFPHNTSNSNVRKIEWEICYLKKHVFKDCFRIKKL